MNHYALSCEIAYRHENLQRIAMRRRSKSSTCHLRRSWLARRRTTMPKPEPNPPPAPLTLTMPDVGTAEFNDLATEVG